ncbi:MAG: hypothetical protein UHI81_09440 [Olegusella sp.]|nr:hypothetical protein [Olegusella sp.]
MSVRELGKRVLHGCLEVNPRLKPASILTAIQKADVVSFDVFDTVLKRNVPHPADVFTIAARAYERRYGTNVSEFPAKRVAAEKNARALSKREVTLEDIYAELDYDAITRQKLQELELGAERVLSVPCKSVKSIYDHAIALGKRVVFTSDMYLPRLFVQNLLSAAGYDSYEGIYVSCEYGVTKRDGGLFQVMLSDVGAEPVKVVHIGDSLGPDYISAKKAGLNAILIATKPNHVLRDVGTDITEEDAFAYGCVRSLCENTTDDTEDYFYRFGYETFGPLLYGICDYLMRELDRDKDAHLYFLARDGYVVQKAFELLYPESTSRESYLYASRRSYRVPLIEDEAEILEALPHEKYISPVEALEYLGLPADEYRDAIRACGLDPDKRLDRDGLKEDARVGELISQVSADVLGEAREELRALKTYLDQQGVCNRFFVFDIGWAGSIQNYLETALNKLDVPHSCVGYYVGLSDESKEYSTEAHGFIDGLHPKSYIGLVEECFLARTGSTEKFVIKHDGTAAPVLLPYEYEGRGAEIAKIDAIQKGALDFVIAFKEIHGFSGVQLSPSGAYASMRCIGTSPTRNELEHLGKLLYFSSYESAQLANPKSLGHYLLHPKEFYGDAFSSYWRVGFLKKMLKLPLPYEKLYMQLRKLRNGNR